MKTKSCPVCNGSGRKGSISRSVMANNENTCGTCGGTGRVTDHTPDYDPVTGKPTGCFPAGSLILTPAGNLPIECLTKGDLVLSPNGDGALEAKRVLRREEHKLQRLWSLTLDTGARITATPIHSFLCQGVWKKAEDIVPVDKILCIDRNGFIKEHSVVESVASEDKAVVYNLIVSDNFTFVACGALVHSFTYFRSVRVKYWRLSQIVARLSFKDFRQHLVGGGVKMRPV